MTAFSLSYRASSTRSRRPRSGSISIISRPSLTSPTRSSASAPRPSRRGASSGADRRPRQARVDARRAAPRDGGVAMAATERQAFYERIAPANLAPLWEQLHSLVTPEPTTSCVPALWRYEEIRPHLMQAGGLITAHEAPPPLLIPGNPGFKGQGNTTPSAFWRPPVDLPRRIRP